MLYRQDSHECERWSSATWPQLAPATELRPEMASFAIVSPRERGRWHAHRHLGYELILPERARGYECQVNGTHLALAANEALFLCPDDVHADILVPDWPFYVFNFHLRAMDDEPAAPRLFAAAAPLAVRRARFDERHIHALLAAIRDHIEHNEKTAYYAVNAYFAALFWTLVAAMPETALAPYLQRKRRDDRQLSALLRLFDTHADRPMDNHAMARHLNISVSSLTHRCARLLGESPARAFLRHRITRATETLQNTPGVSVKEVAARYGFANEFHFSRAFKRIVGQPPSTLA